MGKFGTDLKYYHFDELGSTLFLTDASGVQTDKYVYNAWGKVVLSSGSTANLQVDSSWPLRKLRYS